MRSFDRISPEQGAEVVKCRGDTYGASWHLAATVRTPVGEALWANPERHVIGREKAPSQAVGPLKSDPAARDDLGREKGNRSGLGEGAVDAANLLSRMRNACERLQAVARGARVTGQKEEARSAVHDLTACQRHHGFLPLRLTFASVQRGSMAYPMPRSRSSSTVAATEATMRTGSSTPRKCVRLCVSGG